MDTAARDWAREEFGGAELGDRRRVDRLIAVAARAAVQPAGTVTSVVTTSAEREGAFRLLENPSVSSSAIASASHAAAVERCRGQSVVYVPIDGSSLSLRDRKCLRDIGKVGAWSHSGRGLIVTSALAVSLDGTPLGVCGQQWTTRTERSKHVHRYRAAEQTLRTVQWIEQVHERFLRQVPDTEPWYQLDRGFDMWPLLQLAHERELCMTVRMNHDRRVRDNQSEDKKYLFSCTDNAPLLGRHHVEVPARRGRPARTATLEVRARKVSIELILGKRKRQHVPMYVVSARETIGEKSLHWRLITTVPVESFQDALAVINGYTTRWRIEELHRAWKRGVCHVEDTQLRGRDTILKWATILAAVAARATHLTYLAREKPDIPATEELSRFEIDAAIALLKPRGIKLGATPTLVQAVGWIAEIGGFAGKYSGKPPGPTVVARGLERVEILAEGLKNMNEM